MKVEEIFDETTDKFLREVKINSQLLSIQQKLAKMEITENRGCKKITTT